MKMPIVDLSDNPVTMGQIDWNKPQDPGTYRCDRGWESGGYQYGCLKRATTDVLSEDIDSGQVFTEHLCTEHTLIAELSGIKLALVRQTETADEKANELGEHLCEIDHQLEVTAEALWDINYTLMPLYRKLWYRLQGWRQKRRGPQLPTPAQLDATKSCTFCWPAPCTLKEHASPVAEMEEHDLRGLDQ